MVATLKLKKALKQLLVLKQNKEYLNAYGKALKAADYPSTVARKEEEAWEHFGALAKGISLPTVHVCEYKPAENGAIDIEELESNVSSELIIFYAKKNGSLSADAVRLIQRWFAAYPNTCLLYGDEDVRTKEGMRIQPWLKPKWSPQLLASCFYFGSVIAIRRELLGVKPVSVYELCYDIIDKISDLAGHIQRKRICHAETVLFHNDNPDNYNVFLDVKRNQSLAQCKVNEEDLMVSIIIPSKDNPDILKQNLDSLQNTVKKIKYEVVVVDNGSSAENKEMIEKLKEGLTNSGFIMQYLYEEMPFNFSKMCNIGASVARGKVLLFLNDDIEAANEGWLEKMVDKALWKQNGAIGAKLLYPGTTKIQHAGIVNIYFGPVHKLQFHDDTEELYFRRNYMSLNVLAVTGACLMMRKEVFIECGGFYEELPVAFNDVDLCFTLHDRGYFNVVMNDIVLYHHESLSRGNDESEEKLKRLQAERDVLYARHEALREVDPYYHKWLNHMAMDTGIRAMFEEEVKTSPQWVTKLKTPKNLRLHPGLHLGIEACIGNYLQGYGFMIGDDNACYKRELVFASAMNANICPAKEETSATYQEETIWKLSFNARLRTDLEDKVPDQKNVAMSGFAECVSGLPEGEYYIGMVMKNRITGVTYINWSRRRLQIV